MEVREIQMIEPLDHLFNIRGYKHERFVRLKEEWQMELESQGKTFPWLWLGILNYMHILSYTYNETSKENFIHFSYKTNEDMISEILIYQYPDKEIIDQIEEYFDADNKGYLLENWCEKFSLMIRREIGKLIFKYKTQIYFEQQTLSLYESIPELRHKIWLCKDRIKTLQEVEMFLTKSTKNIPSGEYFVSKIDKDEYYEIPENNTTDWK